MTDSDNLALGVTPSMAEIAIERAMKEAEENAYNVSGRLRYAAMLFSRAFREDPEYAIARIEILSANLEEIQAKIDEARNILGGLPND